MLEGLLVVLLSLIAAFIWYINRAAPEPMDDDDKREMNTW
jgi:hypothetical protein